MIYAVVALGDGAELPERVREVSKAIFDLYAPRTWFVAFEGTTDELTNLLWPDDEEGSSPAGAGLVLPIETRSGYASAKLWEWLKVHSK